MSAAVVTENLQKVYRLWGKISVPALNGVDIDIAAGAFVAIMGPSGAGKSTLMHLLAMLDEPTDGRIVIHGHDVSRLHDEARARFRLIHIGFVFQSFNLFPELSALENTMLPALIRGCASGESERRARELLAAVDLDKTCFPHPPTELSGGDQQRVAVARALINNPALILADEPTANMDSQTALTVLDLFRRVNRERGQTIIMVTHEEDWAAKADRIIRLLDGRIV